MRSKSVDVSEKLVASIFRAKEKDNQKISVKQVARSVLHFITSSFFYLVFQVAAVSFLPLLSVPVDFSPAV